MTTYATLSASPWIQVLDDNGVPYPGAKCYTYAAGTSTPKATYTDYDSGITQSNPIVSDSGGVMQIWLGTGLYKLVFKDTDDNLIRTIDDVGASGSGLTTVMVVNTVTGSSSSLKALAANAANAVIALGYASVSDNAGGLFRWSSTTTSGEDDGIVVDGNTSYSSDGRWVRDVPGYIDPMWYGAAGDGVTSDVTEFAAALVYAAANTLPLKIREGNYYLNSSVTFGTTPVEFDAKTKFTFSNFAPSLNAVITDFNQHFVCSSATYVPKFPKGTVADPRWFGATTAATDQNLYIQEAVNSIAASGTVMLHEPYSLASVITLGAGADLKGDGTGGLTVMSTFSGTYAILPTGNNVIEGLRFTGNNGALINAVATYGNNVRFANNKITNAYILVSGGNDLVIEGNDVSCDTTGNGIQVAYTDKAMSRIHIRNNTLTNCKLFSMSEATDAGNIKDLYIEHNKIRNPTGYGIKIGVTTGGYDYGPSGEVVIKGNTLVSGSTQILSMRNTGLSTCMADRIEISDNVIDATAAGAIGIYSEFLAKALISHNTMYGSGDGTCISDYGSDASWASNTQKGMPHYDIIGYETLANSFRAQYNGDATCDGNLFVGVDTTRSVYIGGDTSMGGSIYAGNIDYTTASGTFDATFQYDGIAIQFSYVVFANTRVELTWPKGADMTGGATQHNALGTPVPAAIRPDGTNVYQYCPAFAWDYNTNTTGPAYIGIVSNGQLFVGQSPSLTSNTIRVERGGCVYRTTN